MPTSALTSRAAAESASFPRTTTLSAWYRTERKGLGEFWLLFFFLCGNVTNIYLRARFCRFLWIVSDRVVRSTMFPRTKSLHNTAAVTLDFE